MIKKSSVIACMLTIFLFTSHYALAHCEIPCGIYDDKMRITMIEEHIKTIEKSMGKISELKGDTDNNQLVRWVMNKEDHANQLQNIVSQYFLTQRIKPDQKSYGDKVETLHKMLVYAMKCKQTTDLRNAEELRKLLHEFEKLYFAKHQ